MTKKEKAADIRKKLKALGWTRTMVSVRGDGSAIHVTIKDASVPLHKVKEIAEAHEKIDRCHISHEILSGGNTFVFVDYDDDLVGAKADELEPLLNDDGETALVQGYEVREWGGNSIGAKEYCISQAGGDLNRNVRCHNKRGAARALAIVLMDGGFDAYGEWIGPAADIKTYDQAYEVRRKREAVEMAEYKAKKAAEQAERDAKPPPPPVPDLPKTGLGIRFNWSESGYVDGTKIFTTFKAANAHLKAAEVAIQADLDFEGREWLGYYKTDFTVAIDGEEYTGRFDIGCDDDTLEAHILSFCNPKENTWLTNSSVEDKIGYAEWALKVIHAMQSELPATVMVKVPPLMFPAPGSPVLN